MLVTFLRALIVYFVIIFAVRLMGKRQLGELQPSELVITILISNLATLPIEEPAMPLFMGLFPILTLVSIEVIISVINMHCPRLRRVFTGSPVVVIKDGEIDQRKLHILRYSAEDLLAQLRNQNIYDISEVDYALVETTGQLSVYSKYSHRPLTPSVMGYEDKPQKNSPPIALVCEGRINHDYLRIYGRDKDWLVAKLQEHSLSVAQVYLMTVDGCDNTVIIKKEDKR